jgi:hypothetical protein
MPKYILYSYNHTIDNNLSGGYIHNFFKYNKIDKPPHISKNVPRIIAIGDIHGDFKLLIKCLLLANVIDNNYNWIGGNTYVVQVGDQIDNCREINNCIHNNDVANDIEILIFMYNLNKKAKKFGGAVYSLLGNHEIMNIEGDMRYVSYKNLLKFGNDIQSGIQNRVQYFNRGSEMSKMLAYTRHSGLIIGEVLFVHAGILPILAKKFKISNINRLIRSWILGFNTDTNLIKMIKDDIKLSPFWIRLFGELKPNLESNNIKCNEINNTLDIYNLKGMVIGHTPQFFPNHTGINSTCGNKLWRVDFGGSNSFNNFDNGYFKNNRNPQVLEILDDMTPTHNLTYNILL